MIFCVFALYRLLNRGFRRYKISKFLIMTYKEYQDAAKRFKTYPEELKEEYLSLGMRGEAGEVCDKVKKLIRDFGWKPGDPIPDDQKKGIALELGDVMWYAAMYALEHNKSMATGSRMNEAKPVNSIFFDPATYNSKTLIGDAINMYNYVNYCSLVRADMVQWVVLSVGEVARCIDITLNDICEMNINKLSDRLVRNKINGSGDER